MICMFVCNVVYEMYLCIYVCHVGYECTYGVVWYGMYVWHVSVYVMYVRYVMYVLYDVYVCYVLMC